MRDGERELVPPLTGLATVLVVEVWIIDVQNIWTDSYDRSFRTVSVERNGLEGGYGPYLSCNDLIFQM